MDIAVASVALIALFAVSYVSAWNHAPLIMVVSLVGAVVVAVCCDTALSPLVEDTILRGWDRFVDIGPALILAGSLFVGYIYAWKRALFHVLVCLALAAGTICLGW